MAWENRNGRGRYYTRSKREGGCVVREYFGNGPLAEVIAQLDAEERAERLAELEERQNQRAEASAVSNTLTALAKAADELMVTTLVTAGYHQHKGQWRKRRKTL